jgi:hypothetical protein
MYTRLDPSLIKDYKIYTTTLNTLKQEHAIASEKQDILELHDIVMRARVAVTSFINKVLNKHPQYSSTIIEFEECLDNSVIIRPVEEHISEVRH